MNRARLIASLPVSRGVRNRLISGFVLLIPLGITIYAVRFLYSITAGTLLPVVENLLGHHLPRAALVVISAAVFLAFLYFLGSITAHVVGRRIIAAGETLLLRVPIVRPIYSSAKQVLEAFTAPRGAQIKSVVLVPFPHPGMRSVAFVMGKAQMPDGKEWLKVFVPTTPNPTSGFFQFIPPEDATATDLTVEDGIKMIMSVGVVGPSALGQPRDNPFIDSDEDGPSAS